MMLLPKYSALLTCLLASGLHAGEVLVVGSANAPADSTVLMPVGIQKTDPVVGFEFRLNYPASHVETGSPSVAGSSDHAASASDDQAGTMTVVVYSITNAEIPADIDIKIPLGLLANSPGGGPSVSISNITFTDALGNGYSSGTTYPLIETWRRANFTLAEREDPDIIGDDANPDNDGVPNLMELLMGKDPNAPDFTFPPISYETDQGPGNDYLRIKFNLLKDAAVRAAATVSGEVSSDLILWDDTNVTVTPTGVETPTTEEVELEAEVTGEAKKFFRITGTRSAGN